MLSVRRRLVWPLPALLAWALAWALFAGLRWLEAPSGLAIGAAAAFGALLSLIGDTPWRRAFIALGLPLSMAVSGLAGGVSAWVWLLPLGLLALLYPLDTWRDAPMFPTPAGALRGLAQLAPLTRQARVLDAGCGLGDGLRELRREYPGADLHGLEWSWPLRLLCGWRCRDASVRRADLWAADWSGFEMVYLFQRPESIARAVQKAMREMRPGAWLASLEFDAATVAPTRVLESADGRRIWLYQVSFRQRGGAARERDACR